MCFRANLKRLIFSAAVLLMGLLFVAGCGVDQSPVASSDGSELTPAAKKPADKTDSNTSYATAKTTTSWIIEADIGPRGGKIRVQKDHKKISFDAPKGAVDETTHIVMEVLGEKASELEIVFGPSPLKFNKTCELVIELDAEIVDLPPEELAPYHLYSDGTVDQAGVLYYETDGEGFIYLVLAVDGFSRYGLSGDYYASGGIGGF